MNKRKTTQKGSALVYILVALAILAALTATFMGNSGQNTTSTRGFDLVSELNTQINFIRSAIQECVLTYPNGDTTMPTNPSGEVPVIPYPLFPTNPYLASPEPGYSSVKDIGCPGNPGNSNDHARIFTSATGKFLPPPPKLFYDWGYYNHNDGVMIVAYTEATDAFVDTALRKLDANFSKCETQYVDATAADVWLDTDNMFLCPMGYKCFVVHLVTTASTLYPGEVGCP